MGFLWFFIGTAVGSAVTFVLMAVLIAGNDKDNDLEYKEYDK